MTISLLSCKKIAKKSGIKRISKDALEELRDILEDYAKEVALKSWRIAQHSDRNTLLKKDVELVIALNEK
ncbi:MAG: NFYB/HAP3 family transcription factor subunit [Candidatus Aenigmatarchaeota archaeon]